MGTALNEFGRLDIAFNNAGATGKVGPFTALSIDAWRTILDADGPAPVVGDQWRADGSRTSDGKVLRLRGGAA